MGKTLLLNTIAACHAAASLPPDELSRISPPPATTCGHIRGADLRIAYDRVFSVRLRGLTGLEGAQSPFAVPGLSVGDAAAWAIAHHLGVQAAVVGASEPDFGAELFGQNTPRTLWLLDGFDEAPGAKTIARALAAPAQVAFLAAREQQLAAPCDTAAEVAFRAQAASSLPPTDRLPAVLRILLLQQSVVVSSRPQFEALLAPLTGPAANARHLRVEPLAQEAVQAFVKEALKVGKASVASLGHTSQRQPPCLAER